MSDLSDALFKLITGVTPGELDELSSVMSSQESKTRPDRMQHALASKLAADRVGSAPVILGGGLWEVLGGLQSALSGKPFVNDATGYDPGDVAANVGGTQGLTPGGQPLTGLDELIEAIRAERDPLKILLKRK